MHSKALNVFADSIETTVVHAVSSQLNAKAERSLKLSALGFRVMKTSPKRARFDHKLLVNPSPFQNEPPTNPPEAKRSRSGRMGDAVGQITTVTKITMDTSGQTPTRASVEVHRSKKRSVSASRLLDENVSLESFIKLLNPFSQHVDVLWLVLRVCSTRLAIVICEFITQKKLTKRFSRRKTPTALGSTWTRGRPIAECGHKFVQEFKFFASCAACNRQIPLGKNWRCEGNTNSQANSI
jgi:hypothetical protein